MEPAIVYVFIFVAGLYASIAGYYLKEVTRNNKKD